MVGAVTDSVQGPERLAALAELVRWQVRGPCEQFRYSECRYCHATWWDREQHNFDCIVPEARQQLHQAGVSLPDSGDAPRAEPSGQEVIEEIRSDEAVRDAFVDCYTLQGIITENEMNVTPSMIQDWDRVESVLIRAILAFVPAAAMRAALGSAPRGTLANICAHHFDSMVCVAPAGHDGPHVTSNERFPHGAPRGTPEDR
jgi:hypothetical protein